MGGSLSSNHVPNPELEKANWLQHKGPPTPVQLGPRLCLVPAGSPRQLVLADDALSALNSQNPEGAKMMLKSHPGFGLVGRFPQVRWFQKFSYIHVGIGKGTAMTLRRNGDFLVYDYESMVLSIEWRNIKPFTAVNLVRSKNAADTFSHKAQKFAVNPDGTIAVSSRRTLVLGVSPPRLVLVHGQSPQKLRLVNPNPPHPQPRVLDFTNGYRLCRDNNTAQADEWTCAGAYLSQTDEGSPILYDQLSFLRTTNGRSFALDVMFWHYEAGNTVSFVAGHSLGRTCLQGGGRSWVIMTDGSIRSASSVLFLGLDSDAAVCGAVQAAAQQPTAPAAVVQTTEKPVAQPVQTTQPAAQPVQTTETTTSNSDVHTVSVAKPMM